MNISLIGTGLMGQPMAEKLLEAGHGVTVYNRTAEKTRLLVEKGAVAAQSVNEAIQASPCTILMLSDFEAIVEAVFYANKDLDVSGKTFIQMGTIAPDESIDIGERITNRGGEYLEAPVLGSIPQVRAGELIILVGSTTSQFSRWERCLQNFGPQPVYAGGVGQAAAMKLALNQLIASLTAAFSLSLGIILQHRIDVKLFMNILRESALYAPTFDKKLNRMLQHDYSNPNFPIKHLLKDIRLIIAEARKCGLKPDAVAGLADIVEEALKKNYGEQDYSSIFEALVPFSGGHAGSRN